MNRKFLSTIICLAVLLLAALLLPTRAQAASSSDLTFTLNGDGESYSVTDCNSSANGSLTIPATYNGKPVSTIGYEAFYGCSSLTSITIPDSVSSIGWAAFDGCSSLTGVYISDIAAWCNIDFGSTDSNPLYYAKKLYLNGELVTDLSIPDSVTSIGKYAFYNCSSLTSITIGNSVTSIGSYAFRNCSSLTGITIGNSVTSIGNHAFDGCSSLTGVYISDIAAWCNIDFGSTDSNPLFYAKKLYLNGELVTDLSIPDSVTSIGSYAFSSCRSLTSITIPDSVTSIGHGAFFGCRSLTSITIPDSVTSIGSYAFDGCSSLTSITIPDSVTSIGYDAFSGCRSLTSITIPDSVTSIGYDAFSGCSSLTSITIPDSVTSIGNYAFYNCSRLTSITIPDSVTSIGNYVFYDCSSLTSITIGNSVTSIGNQAFYDCSSLTSVTIPDSITYIGDYAFSGCSNLSHVAYSGTQSQWDNISIESNNTALTSASRHYETALIHTNNCAGTSVYCPVCEIYVYQSQNGNGIHTYGEWVVITPATLTATGQMTQTCTACGDAKIEFIEMLVGKVDHWNITLEDDYAVNFLLQVSESIQSTAKVRLTIGTDIVTYNISDLVKTEDGYFVLTANISAAQMNDFITVMVMNGRDIGCNNTYTARQYCDTILADPQHSAYHALVREMLNYGAMAQIYFDYDAEHLANDGITGIANAEVRETADEMIISDKITDLSFYGASLVYRDRIAVRYYFTGDVTDCTFTANGSTYTPVAKDGMYYVEVPDILPQNLDQQITLTVTDADGNELSVTYGPMNYIVRMNQKDNVNLKNLLKALYNYHLAAKQVNRSAA